MSALILMRVTECRQLSRGVIHRIYFKRTRYAGQLHWTAKVLITRRWDREITDMTTMCRCNRDYEILHRDNMLRVRVDRWKINNCSFFSEQHTHTAICLRRSFFSCKAQSLKSKRVENATALSLLKCAQFSTRFCKEIN